MSGSLAQGTAPQGAPPQLPMGGPPAMPPGMGPGMGAPPQMAPPGPPPQQPASSVPPMPMAPPVGTPMQGNQRNLAMFGQMARGGMAPVPGQQQRLTPQEMAMLGRFGDSVIAHLTPGEIAVPPQIQTPKVKADLAQAFERAGVPPSNFVAGSPTASVNPNTQAPEYSFWASILPMLGTIGGALLAPETGGLSVPAGMAIGGAAGGAAGGLIDHQTPAQIALAAAGGGAGGYLGGALGGAGGAAGGAVDTSTTAAANAAGTEIGATAGAPGTAPGLLGGSIPSVNSNTQTFGQILKNLPLKGALSSATGATLASGLATPPNKPYVPPGFNTPMNSLNRNYNQLLGNNNGTTPSFAGYNPYTAVSGAPYNFFPQPQ